MPEEKKLNILTQNTLVPLGVVALLVGATITPTFMYFQLQALSEAVKEIKQEIKEIRNVGATTLYTDYASVVDFCRNFVKKPTVTS